MRKGMLLVFWGLMLLTLTMIEMPIPNLTWIMNLLGYGLCAIGMILAYRSCHHKAFLYSGACLIGAAIFCGLTLYSGISARYNGVVQLACRMMELFGFAKLFEGSYKEFKMLKIRDKMKESDLRMKSYVVGFTFCVAAEAICWFVGLGNLNILVQFLIRLIYGSVMASVMLYSDVETRLQIMDEK